MDTVTIRWRAGDLLIRRFQGSCRAAIQGTPAAHASLDSQPRQDPSVQHDPEQNDPKKYCSRLHSIAHETGIR